MTTSASEHPLKLAADRALAKADERGGADVVRWLAADHCWTVGSSRPTETSGASYLIRRKHDVTNGSDPSKRTRTGFGWAFILTCDCPTEASGYAVCWHKAAVYRWWQKYRRVDGDAYGDLPAHSNANAALHEGDQGDRVQQPLAECPCSPGPVNCPKQECGCLLCWEARSGDVFDGDGRRWDDDGVAEWEHRAATLGLELPW